MSCRGEPAKSRSTSPAAAEHALPPASADTWFIDATHETGLDFVHVNGMSGEYHLPEIIGPGVAFLDYDNDGDLDVYLVQGRALDPGPGTGGAPLKGRLFRNDLTRSADGSVRLHFTDVTDRSGIAATGFGIGVAAGDIDNDGWVDLYLTNFGTNQLYRNNGDGTFTDITKRSGTGDSGFSVSASFVDYDRDGWLDLYVAHYVRYRVGKETKCRVLAGGFDYCPPQAFRAEPSRLYRNNRNGTFTDVTAAAGMAGKVGPAL